MTHKTKFVCEVERSLKKLEGLTFSNTTLIEDVGLGLQIEAAIIPHVYLESVAFTVIKGLRASIKEVIREPMGKRTFPDLQVVFKNHYVENFEVKSWMGKKRGWSSAALASYKETSAKRDPLYFNTWYIDFQISEKKDSFRIEKVTIGKIWDFSTGSYVSGKRKSFRGGMQGTTFENFINNTIKDYNDRAWAFGLLEKLSKDALSLKNSSYEKLDFNL